MNASHTYSDRLTEHHRENSLLVLSARALAYAVSPSPLARVLERSTGGPSLVTVALVSLGVAATASILVVWFASLGVRERADVSVLGRVTALVVGGRLINRAQLAVALGQERA